MEETPDFAGVEVELKGKMREELINRFTEIIYFRPFQKEQVEALWDLLVQQANQRLKNLELFVSLTNNAKQWLINSGFSPELGGRALKNAFDKGVLTAISDLILENNLKKVIISALM